MKPELISTEWNLGLWAWFTAYDKEVAKESYKKGYRYIEERRFTDDVCYLKYNPTSIARNTRIRAIAADGSIKD